MKRRKCFIPRRDSTEQSLKGFEKLIRLFEMSKMFYPPEGLCRAEPERGPIVFTLHFIGAGRGTGDFKLELVIRFFEKSKCFIHRRDSAEQSPKGVQLLLLYILLV